VDFGSKGAFMGLTYNDVRCLMEWRGDGTGGKIVTLGRLALSLHPRDISLLRQRFARDERALVWLDRYRWAEFAEDLFREALKFDSVISIDFSSYEGASVVQDIGAELRPDLIGQFDLAVDGGTLEHVFNYPVAVGNLMRLVRLGGAVYTQNPCNGLAGHGFYQFSPELLYRVFSEQNGFEIRFVRVAIGRSLSIETTTNQPVYDVIDPAKYRGRVSLTSKDPAVLMSLAVKRSNVEPFVEPVLQSDYLEKWSGAASPRLNWKGRLVEAVGRCFPSLQELFARREASVRNPKAFRRVW
jgi:hypothetical protein